jgi:hypothetical protein
MSLHQSPVAIGTGPVSALDVVAVARHGAGVSLSDDAQAAIEPPMAWSCPAGISVTHSEITTPTSSLRAQQLRLSFTSAVP